MQKGSFKQMKKIGKTKAISAAFGLLLSSMMFLQTTTSQAAGLLAETVLENMDSGQKGAYFAGIVEGMAYSRYINDGKQADPGMTCILNWYYEEEGTAEVIMVALRKFETFTANAIIGALVAKECGE